MIMDSEAAVMANFEFLAQTDVDMSDDELSDEIDLEATDSSCHTTRRKIRNKTSGENNNKIIYTSVLSSS